MLRHGQGPLSAASFRLAISFETSMSALGQKQTFAAQKGMSASANTGHSAIHSITSSAVNCISLKRLAPIDHRR